MRQGELLKGMIVTVEVLEKPGGHNPPRVLRDFYRLSRDVDDLKYVTAYHCGDARGTHQRGDLSTIKVTDIKRVAVDNGDDTLVFHGV